MRLPPIFKHGITNENKNHDYDHINRKKSVININEQLGQNDVKNPGNLDIASQDSINKYKGTNQCVSTYNGSLDVKEMPLNPFDFIWYSNTLNQKFLDDKDNFQTSEINTQSFNSNNWSFGSNNQMICDDFIASNRDFEKIKPSKKSKKNKSKGSKKSKKIKQLNVDDNNF